MEINQAEVARILNYEPKTGIFTWRVNRRPRGIAGRVAGYNNGSGYIKISIRGRRYYAHRLAFLLMTGSVPPEIDHRDRDRSNNRWLNLRAATHSMNLANIGDKCGVRFRYGRWYSRFGGEHIGVFDTRNEARVAYVARAKSAGRLY